MGDAVRAERLRVERVERVGRPVLRNPSFAVRAGRVTGLLGPSGSGKTTLMRATVGVQIVSSDVGARLALDGTIVVGAALVALGLAAATLRRRTA